MSIGSEIAVTCFSQGFSCSQAVLISHCEEYGLSKELAYKVSGAFGGGFGHTGGACGAVTGALMLLGLKYGKYKVEDLESKDKTYLLVKELTDQFLKMHGSIQCKDLIKYDISMYDELLKARESGVFKSICPVLVKDAVEMVEKLL